MKLRRTLAALLTIAIVATSGSFAEVVYAEEGTASEQVTLNADVQSAVQEPSKEQETLAQGQEIKTENTQGAGQDAAADVQDADDVHEEEDAAADEAKDETGKTEEVPSEEDEADALAQSEEVETEEVEAEEGDEADELTSTNVDNYSVYGSKWVKATDLFDEYTIDNQIPVPAVTLTKPTSGLYACFFLPYDKNKITSLDSTYDNYSIEIKDPTGVVLDKLLFKDIDDDYILNRVVFADEDMVADRDRGGDGVPWVPDSIKIGTNDDQSATRPYTKNAKYFYYIDLGEYIGDEGEYAFRVNIGNGGNHSDWCYLKGYNTKPSDSLGKASQLKWSVREDGAFDGNVSWTAPAGTEPDAYIVKLYKMKDLSDDDNKKVVETDTLIKAVKTKDKNAFLVNDHGNLTSEEALKYYYTVRSVSASPIDSEGKAYSDTEFSDNLAKKLTSPQDATWDDAGVPTSTAHWTWESQGGVDDKIEEFSVTLLKNGEALKTKTCQIDENSTSKFSVSFVDELKGISPASANYTFTVKAVSSNENRPFVASSDSVESTGPWRGESLGALTWNNGGRDSIVKFTPKTEGEYTLNLYKNDKSIYQKSLGKFSDNMINKFYKYDLKEYMETAGIYYARVTEKTDKTFKEETKPRYEISASTMGIDDSITFTIEPVTKNLIISIEGINKPGNSDQIEAFDSAKAGKGEFEVMVGKVRFRVRATGYKASISKRNLDAYMAMAGSKDIKVRALSADTSKCLHSKWKAYTGINTDINNISINITGVLDGGIKYAITGKKGEVYLTLTGSDVMPDFFDPNVPTPTNAQLAPWAVYATAIKSVTIDDKITRIGNYAFYNLTKITSVKLPSSLKTVGDYSFYGCKGLKTIEFPKNVTPIGKSAFGNVTSLSKAVFTGDAPKVNPLRDENGKIDEDASFNQKTTLYYSTRQPVGWTSAISEVNKVRYWNGYKIAETVIPLESISVRYLSDEGYLEKNVDVYTSVGPGQLNIKAVPVPGDASNVNVTWKSSNASVAKILKSSGNGAVLELTGKAGYATITAVSKYSSKITDTLTIASYASNDKNHDKTKGGYWVKSGSNYYYMEITNNGATKKVVTGWQKVPTYDDWVKWNSANSASRIDERTGTDDTKDSLEKHAKWHYFNKKTGARMTGWLTEYEKGSDGNTILYYLDPSKGCLTYGDKKISGKWYYFNEKSDTVNIEPDVCNIKPSKYSNSQIIGCAKIGWLGTGYKDGTKYYNKNGQALIGWNEVYDDKWFYFDSNGTKQTGWTKVGSNWYYLGDDGVKQYGDDETITYKGMRTYAVLSGDGIVSPVNKRVPGGENRFLMTGRNYDNRNEVNNGKLVSGWDGNNEKYYSPVSFQLQTGFVKVGSSYYYFVNDAEAGVLDLESGDKIKYTGSETSGTVDYYLNGGKMTKVNNISDVSGDDTPIYRFNKNGVLVKTYRKADFTLVDPTVNKNTANDVYDKDGDKKNYYYVNKGNIATGFINVTTKKAKVYKDSEEQNTKELNITHTWYFAPADTLAKRGILKINDKYYLFDQEFHQVKEKTYWTRKEEYGDEPAIYSAETYPANVFVNIDNLNSDEFNSTGDDLCNTYDHEGNTGLYAVDSDPSYTYWFKNGVLATGWYKNVHEGPDDSKKKVTDYFYFEPNKDVVSYGRKYSNGWYNISGSWYEFDAQGKAVIHTEKENEGTDNAMTANLTPMKADNSVVNGSGVTYYKLTDKAGKAKGWTKINDSNKAVNPVNGFYQIQYQKDGVYQEEQKEFVTYLTKGVEASGFKTIKCASEYTTTAKNRKFYFEPASGVMADSGFKKIGSKFYYFYKGNEILGDPNSQKPEYIDRAKPIIKNGDYVKGELASNVWIAVLPGESGDVTYVIPSVADLTRTEKGNKDKFYKDVYRNGPVDAVIKQAKKLYYINSDGTVKTGWLTLSYKAMYSEDYKDSITQEKPKSREIKINESFYFNAVAVPEDEDEFNSTSSYGQMQKSRTVDNGNYYVDEYGIRQ